MGVVCVIVRLRNETIDELVATPRKVWHFYSPDDMPEPEQVGFIGRLLGRHQSSNPLCSAPSRDDDRIDLDKSWDGIDFLLSNGKKDTGICRLLTKGGLAIKEEVGYGKPQAFRSTQVQEFNRLLQAVSGEDLLKRYDAKKMAAANLYPKGIWNNEGDVDYAIGNYDRLCPFIKETARLNQGVILFYT
jgi:hypothetical protein